MALTLDVLNHRGRDADIDYADGPGAPGADSHAPVNYHAYAACTGGRFLSGVERVERGGSRALLLLVGRDPGRACQAARCLSAQGVGFRLGFKETGVHQIRDLLGHPRRFRQVLELAGMAEGFLTATREAAAFVRGLPVDWPRVDYVPTPYPLDCDAWDFRRPVAERGGVFIGTREFRIPSRRHFEAVALAARVARDLGVPVTVFNRDGQLGRTLLDAFGFPEGCLQVVERTVSYREFLETMSRHRLVLQRDASCVPGQIAGDALLCGLPCLGGNSAIEKEAHDGTGARPDDPGGIEEAVRTLLTDDARYASHVASQHDHALRTVGFAAGARRLADVFHDQVPG